MEPLEPLPPGWVKEELRDGAIWLVTSSGEACRMPEMPEHPVVKPEDEEILRWRADQLKYLETFAEEVMQRHNDAFVDARRRASIKCGYLKNTEDGREPTPLIGEKP